MASKIRRIVATSIFLVFAAASGWGQPTGTDRLIQSLQSRVSMFPADYRSPDQLGLAYIQKGRETGDASYYELAKQALNKSLEMRANDLEAASATMHMAVVCMVEHRFRDAVTWAESALALGSGDASPWAIVGDALADMGEYDKAATAYAKLHGLGGEQDESPSLFYQRDSRMSYLRFISGDSQGAIQVMQGAVGAAVALHMPGENIAWSLFQLGDYFFQSGNLAGAENAYKNALSQYPGYYRALAALARVRVGQGRYPEAIQLYRGALAAVPFPEYAAELGDVYAKVLRPEEAAQQYELVEFIGYLSAINKVLYNRELALFYADHDMKLKEALKLARKELEVRQDIYTWDALAWALYKNGDFQEAAEAMSKALRPGTQSAMLFFHAGMIYDGLGERDKARDYLRRALATNPHFHIFYADVALKIVDGRSGEEQIVGGPR
jgi:tetratricopeptide (TPR) repeat protein